MNLPLPLLSKACSAACRWREEIRPAVAVQSSNGDSQVLEVGSYKSGFCRRIFELAVAQVVPETSDAPL